MSSYLFLFNGDPDSFLDAEWMASAVAITITYVVFIMGIPALLFQTFIPEAYRNIYNERYNGRWKRFFIFQLIIAVVIFVASDQNAYKKIPGFLYQMLGPEKYLDWTGLCTSEECGELLYAAIVLVLIIVILYRGLHYLLKNFKSTRNITKQLSDKITDNAILYHRAFGAVLKKDVEDLSLLAKNIQAGQVKMDFMEACERLIEFLLDRKSESETNTDLIYHLLEKAVVRCIVYQQTLSNQENRQKALDILMLVHGHKPREQGLKMSLPQKIQVQWLKLRRHPKKSELFKAGNRAQSEANYEITQLGSMMSDIALSAMKQREINIVTNAIENLYSIQAEPSTLFNLGQSALDVQNMKVAVIATQTLQSKVSRAFEQPDGDKPLKLLPEHARVAYYWIGMLSKLLERDGSAARYAQNRWKIALKDWARKPKSEPEMINTLFSKLIDQAQKHFYRISDFDTADACEKAAPMLKAGVP